VCNPNPCKNNGACVQVGKSSAKCNCTSQFVGYQCEYQNPCAAKPCQNGGACSATWSSTSQPNYKCSCPINYSGSRCEIQISALCVPNFCLNSGTCVSDGFSLSCVCTQFFTGTKCESVINPCLLADGPAICKNGALCQLDVTSANFYKCVCRTGFFGDLCQFSVITTSRTPSTSPSNLCSQNACGANAVSCTDLGVAPFFSCNCKEGYTGPRCDLKIENPPCVDQEATLCKVYAASNLCNEIYNGQLVKQYCPISCNQCSDKETVPCTDLQPNCPLWASLNLCSRVVYLNPVPCRKSCKLCV